MEMVVDSMNSYMSFSNLGSAASIIGLFLTIYLFFAIRTIKRNYLFRARIPALLKKLKKHASGISSALQRYEESDEQVANELSLAEVNLISLKGKTKGKIKATINEAVKDIQKYRKDGGSKKDLRAIYLSINMRIQEIENYREDDKWENGDV